MDEIVRIGKMWHAYKILEQELEEKLYESAIKQLRFEDVDSNHVDQNREHCGRITWNDKEGLGLCKKGWVFIVLLFFIYLFVCCSLSFAWITRFLRSTDSLNIDRCTMNYCSVLFLL
jgi:hypothetical protein